ncbi:polymorphic toxin type 44 domain-containing protein [Shewanella sp. A14]
MVWAFTLFNDGQPLDLKQYGTTADFGNFHYGAYLAAAGYDDTLIFSGASANQAWKDDGKKIAGAWGALKGWFAQDRDHPQDTVQVTRGINYYKEVYKNDNNTANVSDSCDPSNGKQIVSATGDGGGGPTNGTEPRGPAGGRVKYKYSCELWRFPNGLGGYYYMNRNCRYRTIPY